MNKGNIFIGDSLISREAGGETYEDIVTTDDSVKIERIVSNKCQASPEGFWYDQDTHEWVMVLRGSAGIEFAGDNGIESVTLEAGDYVNIAAHVKHRVVWTDSSVETVWLAVHYK